MFTKLSFITLANFLITFNENAHKRFPKFIFITLPLDLKDKHAYLYYFYIVFRCQSLNESLFFSAKFPFLF